ncbi:hypothetical protein GALL_77800 [mine drainage metagenome]|uniref:Lipoprotein n=1 Tax=mine drainage metagenome TaxID=410659 RepID=A0A1J5T9G5_9ZZZZ
MHSRLNFIMKSSSSWQLFGRYPLNKVRRRWLSAVLLSAVVGSLSGCASEPGQKNYFSEPNLPIHGRVDKAPENTTAASLESDVLAFGRIRWFDNGDERTEYRSGWGWNVWFPFYRIQDDGVGRFVVEKDGSFTWRIPRGSYILNRIGWRDAWDGLHAIYDPKVAFEATDTSKAICLGTLVVNLKSKRDIIGKLLVKSVQLRVDDDCSSLALQFHAKYTDPDLVEARSLMRFDPDMRIPEKLQERNKTDDFWLSVPGLLNSH